MSVDRQAWANLSRDQVNLLQEGEQTLGPGVDLLLAYDPISMGKLGEEVIFQNNWRVSRLNESQVECLQGLEQKLKAVVIAYKQSGS